MKPKRAEKFEKLVLKAKRGDKNAFSVLYQEYLTPIFRYLYARLGSRQEAEDLSQVVFIKAWQAIKNFRFQKKPILSWLYTIARHSLIDFTRKKKEIPSENIRIIEPANFSIVDDIRQKRFKTIKQAIGKLNPNHQEIIILKFIEEKSNKEIAQLLNKREDAVRAMAHRAIKSLRQKINEQQKPKN